jgi:glyoxylase-like metal-dependent hydrolase (beta-lactamase superfamily II)
MFTGDAVQARGTRAGNLPQYVDPAAYLSSLRRLRDLPIETICMGHAYTWSDPRTDPVRRGAAVAQCLTESIELTETIDSVVRGVATELPGASFVELARKAARQLAYVVPIRFVRETDIPANAGVTISAHAQLHQGTRHGGDVPGR